MSFLRAIIPILWLSMAGAVMASPDRLFGTDPKPQNKILSQVPPKAGFLASLGRVAKELQLVVVAQLHQKSVLSAKTHSHQKGLQPKSRFGSPRKSWFRVGHKGWDGGAPQHGAMVEPPSAGAGGLAGGWVWQPCRICPHAAACKKACKKAMSVAGLLPAIGPGMPSAPKVFLNSKDPQSGPCVGNPIAVGLPDCGRSGVGLVHKIMLLMADRHTAIVQSQRIHNDRVALQSAAHTRDGSYPLEAISGNFSSATASALGTQRSVALGRNHRDGVGCMTQAQASYLCPCRVFHILHTAPPPQQV